MNNSTKSFLAIGILIVCFAISIIVTSGNDYKDFCEGDFDCVLDLVVDSNDSILCTSLNDSMKCYKNFAKIINSSSICMNSANQSDCLYDFALFSKDHSYCSGLGELYDKCTFEVAYREENVSICKKSNNIGLCYYSYAIESKNVSLCEFSENYKSTCVIKLLENQNVTVK